MVPSTYDDGRALVTQLTDLGTPRPPSSAAEAGVAAYINARLRRSGMRVDTRELTVAEYPCAAQALPAGVAVIAGLLMIWYPFGGMLLAARAFFCALIAALFAPLPGISARKPTQAIIANRAVDIGAANRPIPPRRRVILLAPLDSKPHYSGLARLALPTRRALLGRLLVLAIPPLFGLGLVVWPNLPWWAALPALFAPLPIIAAAYGKPAFNSPTDGGLGALAALSIAAQRLNNLRYTEVWAVGLGGGYADPAGATWFAQRFPFPPSETLVIALQQLTTGQLSYITRVGALRQYAADETLIQAAVAVDSSDSAIDAEPRSYRTDDALALPLQRNGLPSIHILSVANGEDPDPKWPTDPALVERAARFVEGIVRYVDALKP